MAIKKPPRNFWKTAFFFRDSWSPPLHPENIFQVVSWGGKTPRATFTNGPLIKGVEPKIGGKPPKWMVKIMENPIKMDDLGVPPFSETPIRDYPFHSWGIARGIAERGNCLLYPKTSPQQNPRDLKVSHEKKAWPETFSIYPHDAFPWDERYIYPTFHGCLW